jgi:hypothetical protein
MTSPDRRAGRPGEPTPGGRSTVHSSPGTTPDVPTQIIAARLAARGLHVFPCLPGAKRPAVDRWEERACADPDVVTRYWPGPRHNIGIPPGRSGLVVVDLDPPDGSARLEALGREVPATLTVSTARPGGLHLYFAVPEGKVIRNSAGKIAPHVDVRGSGGYVIGPGSVVGGRAYRITRDCPPATLPGWLADLAAPPAPPSLPRPVAPLRPADGYAAAAVRAEMRILATAPSGTRNHELNRSAFSLGQLVAAGLLDEDQVAAALLRAAERNGLLADDGIRQCQATIRSGLRAGMANPRQGVA